MKDSIQKIALFFAEAFKRWGARSPKYMRIWRTVNAILCGIGTSGLASIKFELFMAPTWAKVTLAILSFCGAYGAAMNTLVVSKPVDLPLTEKIQAEKP